jgi:hypothetical protein
MKLLKFTLFACLSLVSISLFAQEKCGVRQNEKGLIAQYPHLEQAAADYQAHMSEMLSKLDLSKLDKNTRGQYIVPMVFHILHNFGAEKVSDNQVFEEMIYINQNYSKTNPTLSSLVSTWIDSAANCGFEFRLARKDPNGNCTNGIEHIYTAKTNEGDNNSKINQWPNQYYLNVWVANAIRGDQGTSGTLAFALKPASVVGTNGLFFYDGIIMKHKWLGTTGTYAGNDHYTLTHEIGHFLGLDHVWGGTNEPLVNCGDDGIGDTPQTEGHFSCTTADLWDSICLGTQDEVASYIGVLQNTQNFMDYAGCGAMYTKGQKAMMKLNLDDFYIRGSLIDSLTHAYTGVLNPVTACAPIADYNSTKRFICVGTPTSITDYSYNGTTTSRNWTFSNATPATGTSVAQAVTFNSVGWQTAALEAINSTGSNTRSENYFFAADPNPVSIIGVGAGKVIADFEGGPAAYPNWPIFNYYKNNFTWEHEFSTGYNGGQCLRYQVIDKRAPFQQTTNNSNRDFDDIFSEAYDLTTLSGPINLGFRSAGASFSPNNIVWDPSAGTSGAYISVINDSMNIYYSTDCGNTWKYLKGYKAGDLHNNGFVATEFKPTALNQWASRTIPLSASIASSNKIFFRFRYFPSNGGNNFYIDDIMLSNYATGVTPVLKGNMVFAVYPNPSNGNNINIKISENLVENNNVTISDITGKILYSKPAMQIVQNGGELNIQQALTQGVYLVNVVKNGKTVTSQKLTIQ